MYKLQKLNKNAWLDVIDKKKNEIIKFKTKENAIWFKIKFFGISANDYIRIVKTKRKNKELIDFF